MKLKNIQEKIAKDNKISKAAAGRILNTVINGIKESLVTDGKFRLAELGILKVKDRNARTCSNPKTKELITVPARKVPTFSPSKKIKQFLNK